jgi:hypothetical protein
MTESSNRCEIDWLVDGMMIEQQFFIQLAKRNETRRHARGYEKLENDKSV